MSNGQASVTEQTLAGIPWLVVRGERLASFRALGAYARRNIHAAIKHMPALVRLRARLAAPAVARHYAAVSHTSRESNPLEWAELEALAAGAEADFDDLLLLNLRGDLGTDDGTGCTDLAYCRSGRALIGHNEDGSRALEGRCYLLTLLIDGDAPVTVWWYPGFIPANTFTLTGHGLAWGIDNINVRNPQTAPGRHFIARALQQETSVGSVASRLAQNPSAGGFAYTIGQLGSTNVCMLEIAEGKSYAADLKPDDSLCWHTNHLTHLTDAADSPSTNSKNRAEFLQRLAIPGDLDAQWLLQALSDPPLNQGVARTPEGHEMVTHCTFVVDLRDRQVTVRPRGSGPVTVALDHLLGGPESQR
jgi:hypothetical protein